MAASSTAACGSQRPLRVAGAFIYLGPRYSDTRGSYEEIELPHPSIHVVQCGHSISRKNVVRGMHCSPYSKIVTCLSGRMWDVIVDLRPESTTFLHWDAVVLTGEDGAHLYVPPRVGHGFMSCEDGTTCLYLKDGRFDRSQEMEINCFDPAIGVQWPRPIGEGAEYVISDKDRGLPTAAEALGLMRRSAL